MSVNELRPRRQWFNTLISPERTRRWSLVGAGKGKSEKNDTYNDVNSSIESNQHITLAEASAGMSQTPDYSRNTHKHLTIAFEHNTRHTQTIIQNYSSRGYTLTVVSC